MKKLIETQGEDPMTLTKLINGALAEARGVGVMKR